MFGHSALIPMPEKVWTISNASEPGVELSEISVSAQESGDQDYRRSVTARYAETVINGRGVKEENVGGK